MFCYIEKDPGDHAKTLLQKLATCRENKEFCDLTIQITENEVYAHRNVLAVSSDYFKAMLQHDTIEKQNGVVKMEDVGYEAVKNCINYIYTGTLTVPLEQCESHINVASIMQLDEVTKGIFEFLCQQINVKTFFGFKKIASKYESDWLNEACDAYAAANLTQLAREMSFSQLESDYVKHLIMCDEGEGRTRSNEKLKVILSWIKADVQNREGLLNSMLSNIDLSNITPEYGEMLATSEPVCYDNAQFMTSLYVAILKRSSKTSKNSVPVCHDSIVSLDKTQHSVVSCKIRNGQWQVHTRSDALDEISNISIAAAFVKGDIYLVCSSQDSFKAVATMQSSRTWSRIPDMSQPHGPFLRCINHKDELYVVGNTHFERLNTKMMSVCWEDITSPLGSCDRSAIVSSGDDIYIVGGLDGVMHSKVWMYESNAKSWHSVAPMNHARGTPGACAHEGKIYVAGGYDNGPMDVFEQYDPIANQWINLPNMLASRSPITLLILRNKIVVCGTSKKATSVDEYDVDEKIWSSLNFLFPRDYVAAATFSVKDNQEEDPTPSNFSDMPSVELIAN